MFILPLLAATLALTDGTPAPSPGAYSPLQCAALTTITWKEIKGREGKRSRDAKAMKALVKHHEKQARQSLTAKAYRLALEIEIEALNNNAAAFALLPEEQREKPFKACLRA